MRNLTAYSPSAIDFFDKILASTYKTKADPTYKDRITGFRPAIAAAYTIYDSMFAANTLAASTALGYAHNEREDLLKLYAYPRKELQYLKTTLTTTEKNRLINTCQNCTVNEINSFDHFLPKEEFPEFAINPKNLFPSCTQCNSYKSINWQTGGSMLFLNLYIEPLPAIQYLYATITIAETIELEFQVVSHPNIPNALFSIIDSHYKKLHLPDRFSNNSDTVVSELVNTIRSMQGYLSKGDILNIIADKTNRDRDIFGFNYWKSILTLALISKPEFYDYAVNLH